MWLLDAGAGAGKALAKARVERVGCTSGAFEAGRLYVRTGKGVACYDLAADRW